MGSKSQNPESRVERVRRLLREPNARIRRLMGTLHPTEIAQILEESDEDLQDRIVRQMPSELVSQALAEMDDEMDPGELLTRLHPRAAATLIESLDPDDAADLLADIDNTIFKDRILHHVDDKEEEVLNRLLAYDEDTAGGLMNPELVSVNENITIQQAIASVVDQSEDQEDFYTIYTLDDNNHLKGYLTFRNLFKSKRNTIVKEAMETEVVWVTVNTDQEEVAKMMSQYNLPTLPVVDENMHLLGRVTFDDVLDVIEEESTEDLLSFAGVAEDAKLRGGWVNAFRTRIPWLLVNLLTASTAAIVLSLFQDIQQQMVALVAFMPIIAGVAGNGATQTLAVTVRRLSTDGIAVGKARKVIFKELVVGAVNGLTLGALASFAALFFSSDVSPMIGVVVFCAMFGNLVISGLAGSFIPIMLERRGVDPAVASSILITAFTDILGYTLLFGLGTLILL